MTATDKKNTLPVQTQRIVNGINLMFAGIGEILSAMEPDMAKAVQALAKATPGNPDDYEEILGVRIPKVTIPVRPGRNLAVILELAAMNNRQKNMGYNAAQTLAEEHDRMINNGGF